MLKKLVNEARFKLLIETTGPLLVKSGYVTSPKADMTPVRTYRNNEWQVFLPGSSLKGVIRSHLEKVGRTLQEDIVCNPFLPLKDAAYVEDEQLVCPNYAAVSCGNKFELRQKGEVRVKDIEWRLQKKEQISNALVYAHSCPICRLFGSTAYIGRVSIGDAYLTSPERTEMRDGVGIDRLTGGAANQAKFDLEVVSSGVTFETEVHLRNFETWQLGMLMLVVEDLADELVRVGSGRSRGLGKVKGKVDEVAISYLGVSNDKPANEVWGLGQFLGPKSLYGTCVNDVLILKKEPSEVNRFIRRTAHFTDVTLKELKTKAIKNFVCRLQDDWKMPDTMKFEHLQWLPHEEGK